MSDMTTYEHEGSALAVREEPRGALSVAPTVSPEEAREAMRRYQEVCEAVLTDDDYQEFTERGVRKRFKKKSAVKKLQTFFSVSVKVHDMVRDDLGDGHFGFRCIATATTPNGRPVDAAGGCSTFEERFELKRYDDESDARYAERLRKANARAYHDVLSTAETRATNRAVMNGIGVGGGEVTADEVSRGRAVSPRSPSQPSPAPAGPTKREAAAARTNGDGPCADCHAPAGKPHATACPHKRSETWDAEARARDTAPPAPPEPPRAQEPAPQEQTVASAPEGGKAYAVEGLDRRRLMAVSHARAGALHAMFPQSPHEDAARHAFAVEVLGDPRKASSLAWTADDYRRVLAALQALPTDEEDSI